MQNLIAITAGIFLFVTAQGCASYYRVTDLHSNRTYYANNVKSDRGTTVLRDSGTDSEIRIQNAEINKISKGEYNTVLEQRRRDIVYIVQ